MGKDKRGVGGKMASVSLFLGTCVECGRISSGPEYMCNRHLFFSFSDSHPSGHLMRKFHPFEECWALRTVRSRFNLS